MDNPLVMSIYVGGVLHSAWAVFHLLFPRVFGWQERLKNLDPVNRNIYQVINLCLVFFFVVIAYLSFFYAPQLLEPGLGRKLLAIFTAFWLLRLGLQFRFFAAIHPMSLLLNLGFAATMAVYAYPLFRGPH